ncbi:redoxin domain-containing protein [Sphingosinithalassobacter portus]|uniref:redoxin domain-containing protein n=1 Tax=Stakelama portus TaxID=2676234 RepID=UPI00137B550D|nr:redoxin domain-containing protein [Sphingosinithalassobacter portus]
MLKPGQQVPKLAFPLVTGGSWSLDQGTGASLRLISFYRGAFCGFCTRFMQQLNGLHGEFAELGIDLAGVSVDPEEVAKAWAKDNGIDKIAIGYGLTRQQIEACGLFASHFTRDGKELYFGEPALWLVRPDGALFLTIQSSVSCGRPDLESLLTGLKLLADQGFPTRGNA